MIDNRTIHAINNIQDLIARAGQLRAVQRYDQAARALRYALELSDSFPELDRNLQGTILDELGTTAFFQLEYEKAQSFYLKAIDVLSKRWYPEHASLANVFEHLSQLYIAQEKFGEAEAACVKALEIREKTLLQLHSNVLECQRMYAIILTKVGKFKEAETLVKKIIASLEASTISPREEFVWLLGQIYRAQGLQSTEGQYKQAMAAFRHCGGRLGRCAAFLRDYAKLLQEKERNGDADYLLARADELVKHVMTIEIDETTPASPTYQRVQYPVAIVH